MARTWIPLGAVESGALPAVCARSGRPADRFLAVTARARAGWTWWLLPLGVLPFLAARHFATRITVLIPISRQAAQRVERLRLAGLLALLLAMASAMAAAVSDRRAPLLVALGLLVTAAGFMAMEATSLVRAQLDPSARGVLLTGVHPAFRDAVDRRQRAAWTSVAE
jgi:hypothetical protein